eukprot:5826963-Alexandrium_andersonii.AAC.1
MQRCGRRITDHSRLCSRMAAPTCRRAACFNGGRPPRTHWFGGNSPEEAVAQSEVVRDLDFFEIFAGPARLTQ